MNPVVVEQFMQNRRIGYLLTNRDGEVIECGGETFLICGSSVGESAEIIGQPLYLLVPELNGNESVVDNLLTGVQPEIVYPWVSRGNGEESVADTVHVTLTLRPYSSSNSEPVGLICIAEDSTAQEGMRQSLLRQQKELSLLKEKIESQNQILMATNVELKIVNEVRTLFSSMAAHKLRNPLTSIYGYIELLLDDHNHHLLSNEQRNSLQIVYDKCLQLLNAVTKLLDAARIDSDRVELLLQPMPVQTLLYAVAEQFAPEFEAREFTLAFHIPPDLPPILCDAKHAVQVIGHLLHNTSKRTSRHREILLSARLCDDGEYLEIAVTHQDAGIDMAQVRGTFYPSRLYALDPHGESDEMGLGLYIVRSLIELHGGHVRHESIPDHGTTFYITFPIVDSIEYSPA